MGCRKPLCTPDETQRLCPDCFEAMLEGLAVKIDPTYDPKVMHEAGECWAILNRLYGETCCT